MQYKVFKILFIFLLFGVSAILPFCIDFNIKGANIPSDEQLTQKIRDEISLILNKERVAAIDSIMEVRHKRLGFNGNVLVAIDGQPVYNEAFGYSNFRQKKELTDQSVFQLASVSKQFTAGAIMLLQEEGKLAYDDTVTKYLPELPYENMTIRMLLNHTAGLANYMWLVEHHWKGEQPPYNDDILKMIKDHDFPLYFKPGRKFDYSNTGYIILASVVEAVSGQRFDRFLKENIFDPLGMENSFVYSTAYTNSKDHVTGYYRRGRRYRQIVPTVNDGAVGDKGICSTTEDLFKWDQALYSNALFSEENLENAFSPARIRDRYNVPYGFGFRIKETNNEKLIYHHGRWNGFRTSFMRYVSDSATIIVLNNTSYSGNNSIVRTLRSVITGNQVENVTASVANNILNDEFDLALDEISQSNAIKNNLLDTLKITKIRNILIQNNRPQTADKFKLILDQYSGRDNYAQKGGAWINDLSNSGS